LKWESFKSTWVREIESGDIKIILVGIPQRHPELPNVPTIGEFAKTDEAKKLIQVAVYDYGSTARPLCVSAQHAEGSRANVA
jgi:hypothetical protein